MAMFRTLANIAKAATFTRLGLAQPPAFVTFFVTWACNHRCIFCDVWKKVPADELSLAEIESIFAQLGRLDVVRLSGGEPFLRKDLADIVNLLDRLNKPTLTHITTNGILTRRIVEAVEGVEHPERLHIKVSIDDLGEKHDRIRGVKGAYDKALETVRELARLRESTGLHVGVNQAILDESSMGAYEALKAVMTPLNVPIYASIAYDSKATIYSEPTPDDHFDPASSVRTFGNWTPEGLQTAMRRIALDNKSNNSFLEQVVDNYFMNGLFARMVEPGPHRGPDCVALGSHLRLLPNGDVPVCLYDRTVVGNLRRTPFKELWASADVAVNRKKVAACPGCWSSCETAVSAIYTGDIWKGLRRPRAAD
jgi:MoaA/NifB/PqqE/SkfB family radical SAM enzyme